MRPGLYGRAGCLRRCGRLRLPGVSRSNVWPHRSVKTIPGTDSQFGPSGLTRPPPANPQALQRLFASAARPGIAGRAAPAVLGATPLASGSVRVRAEVWIHTPAPARQGVAPSQ